MNSNDNYSTSWKAVSFGFRLCLLLCLIPQLPAQENKLLKAKANFESKLNALTEAEYTTKRDDLVKDGLTYMIHIQKEAQAKGDFDGLQAIAREIERLGKTGDIGPAEIVQAPAKLAATQRKLIAGFQRIDTKFQAEQKRLLTAYTHFLKGHLSDITKEGDIEQAKATKQELLRARALLANNAMPFPAAGAPGPGLLADAPPAGPDTDPFASTAPAPATAPTPIAPKTTGVGAFDFAGFAKWNGHIYQIVPEQATWKKAAAACRSRGGYLVCTETRAELQWIRSHDIFNNHDWFFAGGSDLEREGTWVWQTGAPVDPSFWNAGEPNGGIKENCVVWGEKGITDMGSYSWNLQCFLCEYEKPSVAIKHRQQQIAEIKRLRDSAKSYNGHHYAILPGSFQWRAAIPIARAYGGYLACAETPAEAAFLRTLTGANGGHIHLGGKKDGTTPRWVSGQPFTGHSFTPDKDGKKPGISINPVLPAGRDLYPSRYDTKGVVVVEWER